MNVSTKLLVQISANTSQFVAGLNQANKSMGLMQKSLVSLKNTLVGTFGAYAVINGIQNAVNKLAEFDKAMTQVRVITGASGKDFNDLEKAALTLGSTTQYTAKSVGELQLEFGRLGFSTKEILQSTKATVDLATATGEGLARSAEIAGSTLRAFQLDASEMSRVTDVMAAALNQSALTLDTFADGIKYVSPVAKATGVSLEETAAMMSVLADAGIKGSQAGTSLRRIFTMLTNDGKPLQERLQELSEKGITLADANDEVGLYAQTALLQLTAMLPRVKDLTQAFKEAEGATNSMARAMEDNLGTAITKVSTAYDAYILSLRNSKGTLRSIVDGVSDLLTVMSMSDDEQAKLGIGNIEAMLGGIAGLAPSVAKHYADMLRELRQKTLDELTADKLTWSDIIEIDPQSGLPVNFDGKDALASTAALLKITQEDNRKKQEGLDLLKKQNEQRQKAIEFSKTFNDQQMDRLRSESVNANFEPMFNSDAGLSGSPMDISGIELPPPEEVESWFAAYGVSFDDWTNKVLSGIEKQKNAWDFWGNAVADVLDNVIAKDQDFARSAAETAARIIDSTRKEIAAYIAKAAAKALSLNPTPGGIATATAIIGIGLSLVSGVLKKFAKTSDTNVRVNSGSTSIRGNNRMEVYGRFEMSGKTAVALVKSGSYSNAITG